MSEDQPQISTVTEENQEEHRRRWMRRQKKKALLKARDRRKNFERGEYAGFLYCLGLGCLWVAASGEVTYVELETWHRVGYVAGGISALGAKTVIKRFFWKQTEDAEYKDEEDAYRRTRKPPQGGSGPEGDAA